MAMGAASRYHLHIVDGGDRGSTVTAATLFAHLTLRCGQLRKYLLLSASTTDAKRRRESTLSHLNTARMVQLTSATVAPSSSGERTDDDVLLAAEALLRGDEQFRASLCEETAWSGPIAEVMERIIPYPCFSCTFAESEASLARSGGRYFDFIATADVASFDYLLDYYLALRMWEETKKMDGCSVDAVQWRSRPKVGLVHILSGEPARAGYLLQRFVELLLEVDKNAVATEEEGVASEAETCAWISRVDSVIAHLYQLLGVDILFTLLVGQACRIMGFAVPPLEKRALKKRYIELVKKHHPDQNGPAASAERMANVAVAYKTLQRLLDGRGQGVTSPHVRQSHNGSGSTRSRMEAGTVFFTAPGASLSMAGWRLPWQRGLTTSSQQVSKQQLFSDTTSLYSYVKRIRAMEQMEAARAELQRAELKSAEGSHGFTVEHFEAMRRMQQQQQQHDLPWTTRRQPLVLLTWRYCHRRMTEAMQRWWAAVLYVVFGR